MTFDPQAAFGSGGLSLNSQPGLSFSSNTGMGAGAGGVSFGNFNQLPAVNINQAYRSGGITGQANTSTNSGPAYNPPPAPSQPSFNPDNYKGWDSRAAQADFLANPNKFANQGQQQQVDPYAAVRNDISSGWDSYINSLEDVLNNGLTGQRTAQEDIANSQYTQGANSLDLQKTQGLQQLDQQRTKVDQNQTKTLKNLSSNLRNSFQAGNIYLGSRGAGDSSASDQYSTALTKMGNQQRGDVMNNSANILNEIGQRETNLNNVYNTEVKNLGETKNQQIAQVAQWFATAQNQLKQQIAQGGLGKSQDLANLSKDLLNRGLQQIASINQNAEARYNALTQWATTNATNINQVKSNLQQIAQFAPQMQGFSPIVGTPQVDSGGNFNVPSGYGGGGGSSNEQKDMFGNTIRG